MMVVGFSTRNGNLLSWLIRKVTGAPYSHVWLMTHDSLFHDDLVFESGTSGFAPVSYERFRQKNTVIKVVAPCHQDSLRLGLARSVDMLGEGYDFAGLAGMTWVEAALYFLHCKIKNPWRIRGRVFCSEAIIAIMASGHYPNIERLSVAASDPRDLDKFLTAEGPLLCQVPK